MPRFSKYLARMRCTIGPAPVLPVLFMAGLISGSAHGFLYPGLAALATDLTPPERRAAVVGVFSAMFLVGNAGARAFWKSVGFADYCFTMEAVRPA